MSATLNVQGSCNNLCDDYPDSTEYMARNAANIDWMQGTFQTAKDQGCVAVMLITQADPGWDDNDPKRAPTRNPKTLVEDDGAADGFKDFLLALRPETIAFGKPVATCTATRTTSVSTSRCWIGLGSGWSTSRASTFGGNQPNLGDVNWLKVNVDPSSPEVFSYEQHIVNRGPVLVP